MTPTDKLIAENERLRARVIELEEKLLNLISYMETNGKEVHK